MNIAIFLRTVYKQASLQIKKDGFAIYIILTIAIWYSSSRCVCAMYLHELPVTMYETICYLLLTFLNQILLLNGLDADLHRHSVGPDLGPNCLQRLSADDKRK